MWTSIDSVLIAVIIFLTEPLDVLSLENFSNQSGINLSSNEASSYEIYKNLEHSSILFGVFGEILNNHNNDEKSECVKDVETIMNGIYNRDVWALKILDANANIPSSFVNGNNFWFAPIRYCHSINEPISLSLLDLIPKQMRPDLLLSKSPIPLQHRMVYANFTSLMQIDVKFHIKSIVHIGLCMPLACRNEDISGPTQNYLNRYAMPIQRLLEINMTVIGTKSTDFNSNILKEKSLYLLCAVCAFVVLSTLLSVLWNKSLQIENETEANKSIKKEAINRTLFSRIVKCFNVVDNFNLIFTSTERKSNFLSVIAGIRTIVCFWVLLFHINYHSAFTLDNIPELSMKMEWFRHQPIFQAYLYVDAFFVLSALLAVYNFLRNDQKQKQITDNNLMENVSFFLKHCFHRYIRLTPIVIVVMIASELLVTYLEQYSPFWIDPSHDLYCRESWWRNLFYIQNFFPFATMCDSWTWYLACDMQYYIICMALLFIYVKNPRYVKTAFILITVLLLSISFYIHFINNAMFKTDVMESTMDTLYIAPWNRCNPFLGGAIIGWILYRIKSERILLSKWIVTVFWLSSFVIFLCTIYMTYNRDFSVTICSLWYSVGKFSFGLFIGAIILVCHLGYGGLFGKILSHSIFIHLNRLTYSIYMVSPVVIAALNGLKETSSHFDEMSTLTSFVAVSGISYIIAIVTVILFELPYQKLSDEFVLQRTKVK